MTSAERSNARQPPWVGPESEGTTFGSWLRQQREVRQIGLREIAESSKVSLRYLEAFEQDRFDLLPASVFAKGFLRQYAEYVGLDGDEVINHYLWARQEGSPSPLEERLEERPSASPRESRGLWPVLLVAFLVLAVIVALVLLLAERDREQPVEQQPRQAFVPPVAPSVPGPPTPEPAAETATETSADEASADGATLDDGTADEPAVPLRVTVEFIRDCWVEAVVDGSRRIAREYSQGESLQIEAQERVVFRKLGNAGGVNLEVNGEVLQLDGGDGQVLSNVTIDLDTAAALGAAATPEAAP